jgi:hypothetical protein
MSKVRTASDQTSLTSVVRQQILVMDGLLDEVARNYVLRLHREIGQLARILQRTERASRLTRDQKRDLKKLIEQIGRLQISPEKGRRKDLKKIDALIGKVQSVLETW